MGCLSCQGAYVAAAWGHHLPCCLTAHTSRRLTLLARACACDVALLQAVSSAFDSAWRTVNAGKLYEDIPTLGKYDPDA